MNSPISVITIITLITVTTSYVIVNIVLQLRAKKRLERLLLLHRSLLKTKFEKQTNDLAENGTEVKYEVMLMLLRQQIDELTDKVDKSLLTKNLDKKTYNNQKRYALKIFSESGLSFF